jgi:CPA2 family monovalent cation:H+ antiporter-2
VGRSIADALSKLKLPCVTIEFDDRRVQQAREAGLPVIYGDASQPVVLEAAGITRARAVLITAPAFTDVRGIVRAVRQFRPELPIIARADGFHAVRALYALGIQEVTSPEFEAAIEMTRQALMYFNVGAHDVLRAAGAMRQDRYGQRGERGDSGLAVMSQVGELTRQLDVVWVGVPTDSPYDGRTLGEIQIRSVTGASVVGIIHDGSLLANPDGQARLERGDLVAVLGTREQVSRFERAVQGAA